MVGPDRELFWKGRRCENQGLGIGAFAYYRRVIEDQKNRLLDDIIKVARRLGDNSNMIEVLEKAKLETQFNRAMEMVKTAIPVQLLINGHNPLTLLHSALSKGVHEMSDDECLTRASDIRVVLFELADRIGQTLKEQSTLDAAVARLAANKK